MEEQENKEQLTDLEKIRIQIRAAERADAEAYFKEAFEVWKADELLKLEEKMTAQVKTDVEQLVEKWINEQKPPSKEDIQKMVSQEYVEFPIKVMAQDQQTPDSEKLVEYDFVIRELPQAAERKFFRMFKGKVSENASQINAWIQKGMGETAEKKILAFLETVDNGFDVLAEATVLVLNPRGRREFVTKEWVAGNISSSRQMNIVLAQADVNRIRDFFSQLSRNGRWTQTMTESINIRSLHQLAQS